MKFHIYRELTKYKNYSLYQIRGEIWWDQRAIAIDRPTISPLYEEYNVIILLEHWVIFHVSENYYFAFDFYAYESGWLRQSLTISWRAINITPAFLDWALISTSLEVEDFEAGESFKTFLNPIGRLLLFGQWINKTQFHLCTNHFHSSPRLGLNPLKKQIQFLLWFLMAQRPIYCSWMWLIKKLGCAFIKKENK